MLTIETFCGKMIVLPNRGTDMMCQNNFGGKMIISLFFILFIMQMTLIQAFKQTQDEQQK